MRAAANACARLLRVLPGPSAAPPLRARVPPLPSPSYERSKFGMKLGDMATLSRALKVTETLTILALPSNLLDDATVRLLAAGLAENVTITSLDLSHNRIADRGVKALAKLLDDRCVILSLNLCDNHVHADGGKYFGRALRCNCSLHSLNLRLNRLGDEGGKLLLDGALESSSLTSLNLSCNALDFALARDWPARQIGPPSRATGRRRPAASK